MRLPPELEERILAMPGVVIGGQTIEAPKLHECHGEAAFQRAVTDLAEANGWKWHHHQISKRSKSGWPDLILVRHRVIVAELKVGTNKPTAPQLGWLEAFQAASVDAYLWYPQDWPAIVDVLTEVKK